MPPNTGSGILDQFECSYKQAANPYSERKHACFEECPGTSGSGGAREHEAPELAVDDAVRVTTRARQTYELYNYSKNAMLIVNSTINAFESAIKIKELETTFAKFRFEIEVVNLGIDNLGLYEKCEQFFQRDFTDYGAVALVILSAMVVRKPFIKGFERKYFKETIIVDNFKLERNPTLVDKPKIYITELCMLGTLDLHYRCSGYASSDLNRGTALVENGIKVASIVRKVDSRPNYLTVGRGFVSCLDDNISALRLEHATHGSVIGFHSRVRDKVVVSMKLDQHRSRKSVENGPLMRFCRKLAALGDNVALSEIIAQTRSEDIDYHKKYKFISLQNLADRIVLVDTLDKLLYFARVEEN